MMSLPNRILTDLGIISKIKMGQTLSKRNGKIGIVNHDWTESAQRFRYNESRSQAQTMISFVINDAIEYSNLILESVYIQPNKLDEAIYHKLYVERFSTLIRFKESLDKAYLGIEKLASTYKSDGTFQQELATIRANINQHVKTLDTKIKILHEKNREKLDNKKNSRKTSN